MQESHPNQHTSSQSGCVVMAPEPVFGIPSELLHWTSKKRYHRMTRGSHRGTSSRSHQNDGRVAVPFPSYELNPFSTTSPEAISEIPHISSRGLDCLGQRQSSQTFSGSAASLDNGNISGSSTVIMKNQVKPEKFKKNSRLQPEMASRHFCRMSQGAPSCLRSGSRRGSSSKPHQNGGRAAVTLPISCHEPFPDTSPEIQSGIPRICYCGSNCIKKRVLAEHSSEASDQPYYRTTCLQARTFDPVLEQEAISGSRKVICRKHYPSHPETKWESSYNFYKRFGKQYERPQFHEPDRASPDTRVAIFHNQAHCSQENEERNFLNLESPNDAYLESPYDAYLELPNVPCRVGPCDPCRVESNDAYLEVPCNAYPDTSSVSCRVSPYDPYRVRRVAPNDAYFESPDDAYLESPYDAYLKSSNVPCHVGPCDRGRVESNDAYLEAPCNAYPETSNVPCCACTFDPYRVATSDAYLGPPNEAYLESTNVPYRLRPCDPCHVGPSAACRVAPYDAHLESPNDAYLESSTVACRVDPHDTYRVGPNAAYHVAPNDAYLETPNDTYLESSNIPCHADPYNPYRVGPNDAHLESPNETYLEAPYNPYPETSNVPCRVCPYDPRLMGLNAPCDEPWRLGPVAEFEQENVALYMKVSVAHVRLIRSV